MKGGPCFWDGVDLYGKGSGGTGWWEAVRSGVGKGNGVDYRLFNLGGSVQLGTHIRKRGYVELRQDAGGRRRDSQSTKRICSRLCDLSCASRSVGRSSSLARAVCSGVGERCRREIVIWSPQRPRAASIARFGQECSRSPTTTWASVHILFYFCGIICSTCL